MVRTKEEGAQRLRVLIPTSRDVYRLVSYGMVVDFEDAVASKSDCDLVPVPLRSRRAQVQGLVRGKPVRAVNPPRSKYDVCLLVAMSPYWVPSLRYIRNLRQVAKRIVVYLFDAWLSDLSSAHIDRHAWSHVDDLFVSFPHAVDRYSEQLGCRVHYLPQAIDKRWFHPYRRQRPIDLLSVGRRLPAVHGRLLEIARRRDLFYYYQTHQAPQAIDLCENQELLGRLCQSSRVHVSWSVERTDPRRINEGAAVTARWFESAASGAVVIGAAPRTEEFHRLFPYPGFVCELDPDVLRETEDVVAAALADPHEAERVELAEYVRATHTWTIRWHEIVDTCGI